MHNWKTTRPDAKYCNVRRFVGLCVRSQISKSSVYLGRVWGTVHGVGKGAGSYLAGMAVAIPILNVDGRRHTNNFSKII